jgi:hypothetical protein
VAGANAVAWLTAQADSFAFTSGKPIEFRSSPNVLRSFCGHCGTPLTYRHDARGGQIDVTLATLDPPVNIAPVDHIWMQDALAWDKPRDGLPQHSKTRRSG